MSNVTYSPNHRQAGAPMMNIQSTLRTSPDLCKNVSLASLFSNKGNSYAVSTQSDMWICTHVFHNTETLVGHKKLKCGRQWTPPAEEIFPHAILDTSALTLSALVSLLQFLESSCSCPVARVCLSVCYCYRLAKLALSAFFFFYFLSLGSWITMILVSIPRCLKKQNKKNPDRCVFASLWAVQCSVCWSRPVKLGLWVQQTLKCIQSI